MDVYIKNRIIGLLGLKTKKQDKPLSVLPALRAFVCVHPSSPVDASIATPCQIPSDSLRLCNTNKQNQENNGFGGCFFSDSGVFLWVGLFSRNEDVTGGFYL